MYLCSRSVRAQLREGAPGIPSGCFPAGSPAAPGPCAGSLVGGRAREALGWASAAELGRAPGPKGSSWQAGSAAERQLCPGAAPLHSTAGLGALPAAGTGRTEKGELLKTVWSVRNLRVYGNAMLATLNTVSLSALQCTGVSWMCPRPGLLQSR